jgi:hypothetical protein
LTLTSSVKELGAILQKLINLDKIQNEKTKNWLRLAMRIDSFGSCKLSGILGSVQRKSAILFSQELENEKSRF